MTYDVDLLVVGGGPVGLAAALHARAAGMDVAVVEPRPDPVDKACGEGLMPTALQALRGLGVDPPGRPFIGIRYLADGRSGQAQFRRGPGRGVRRTVLHAALVDRCASAGVRWQASTVRAVEQDPAGVSAAGLRARWLIGADGLHSTVRRLAGLESPPARRPSPATPRYGLRRHFAVAPWAEHVEVHWAAHCEAYVTPVADDLVGVAVLGPAGAGFAESLEALPALAARLRGAEAVTAVRGAGPLRQRAAAVRRGRVLLAGDAAGYVDALTGEGLAVGMSTARAAVTALAAGSPGSYPGEWRRATRRYRVLTEALLALSRRPGPRTALVPAAARFPGVFARAVDLVA